jgi:hypothetical protein
MKRSEIILEGKERKYMIREEKPGRAHNQKKESTRI